MVNINITLPEEIHKKLKIKSVMEGKKIKELFIEILEASQREER